jgi:hypothetical protein
VPDPVALIQRISLDNVFTYLYNQTVDLLVKPLYNTHMNTLEHTMTTAQRRLARNIIAQYTQDGILYTVLKPAVKPAKEQAGRRVPVFAQPKSRYRVA